MMARHQGLHLDRDVIELMFEDREDQERIDPTSFEARRRLRERLGRRQRLLRDLARFQGQEGIEVRDQHG